jgi:hypothetical protein
LACNRTDIEIHISDNASTDETGAVRQRFVDPRLNWSTQSSNLGMAPNWQFLLDHARGTWFLLLSDDDMVEPEGLARIVEKLTTLSGDVVVAGLIVENHITRREYVRESPGGVYTGRDFIIGSMTGEHVVLPSATLLRTQALRAVGGYAPRPYRMVVDAAAWFELAVSGQITVLPNVLCRYAIQPTSLTSSDEAIIGEIDQLYNEWIERLRPSNTHTAQILQTLERVPTMIGCRRVASAPWWRRLGVGFKVLADKRRRSLGGMVRHIILIAIAALGLMGITDAVRGRGKSCRVNWGSG